ncbi:RNA-metabolising metallo-beta-lactamase [Eremomyces bilateralis CBS 781.70]|uniref:Cleavage and polyadenylation specificity factor subunit 2 n=1 Tax=Eremomyces bilateralis CBS 781.70 TaxID=1392243 RepID=A0A6G1GEC4_9PEZI|nr:RNA-metabolising metallo-beta-lactamase [Eremomyces bilateralis CBS 781.70]KAF1816220.1 RNA-metabolising metallo-beta-lactamase [Eremomyces bilateralis CBS 781.70]
MFTFTPLLGAQSSCAASQSILELDGGIKILIDVGWDDGFDVEQLKALERHIPTLSIILLTHATKAHLGAFAHFCKNVPLFAKIPVYATTPVVSLGKTLLQDTYGTAPLASSIIPKATLDESVYTLPVFKANEQPNLLLQPPTADEIAGYFSHIHPLNYSQPHQPIPSPFSPPLNGLTITAYSAGYTLGGTIWHIQHGLESIVYAVDWNQAREHVVSGAAWLGGQGTGGAEVIEHLRRPTALICSSRGAERVAITGGRKKRDDALLDLVRRTLDQDGTVLIPCESSARILELAVVLEKAWKADPDSPDGRSLRKSGLYLASSTCSAAVRHAKSMLEWMDEDMIREFEMANAAHDVSNGKDQVEDPITGKKSRKSYTQPFDFTHLRLVEHKSRLIKALSKEGGKVILASDSSLEWGFSKEVVSQIAQNSTSLVLLVERAAECSSTERGLGRLLWDLYLERSKFNSKAETGIDTAEVVHLSGEQFQTKRVKVESLGPNDMMLYQQYLARQKQLQNTVQTDAGAPMESAADAVDDRSSTTTESSEDSDVEHQGKALNAAATLSHARHRLGLSDAELGINVLLRKKGVYDYDVRGKRGREKIFPFVAKRRRNDDFGDLIRPEDYLRAEERDQLEEENATAKDQKQQTTVGQKRKWGDSKISANGMTRAGQDDARSKRRKTNGISEHAKGSTEDRDFDESESDYSPDEDEPAVPEGPRKAVISQEEIRFHASVAFVDFAGRHDKRSLHMLIPLIRPRKLILVGGEEQETQTLAKDCRKLLGSENGDSTESQTIVFTPVIGDTVDASVDTNAWIVKLSQPLVKRLQWQNVRGLGVVAVTGRLEAGQVVLDPADLSQSVKEDETADSDDKAAVSATPILGVLPSNLASATRAVAAPLHVGDLRLADLRKLMQSSGYLAEFRGEGTLLINGSIAVRKSGTGRVEIESNITAPNVRQRNMATFYDIRRKIYEGLAVVAGG